MVEEERYCIDVLTQIAAVRSALDGVSLGLLDAHVRHCVANGDPALLDERADELARTLAPRGRTPVGSGTESLVERLCATSRRGWRACTGWWTTSATAST